MAKQVIKQDVSKPTIPTAQSAGQQPQPALSDTKTLRERARHNIEDGAVVESYAGDRKRIIDMLNNALATEYVCVLRYYRHYFMAKGMLADSIKGEFLEHAKQEQAHAGKLAERIVQLGGEPDLNPATLTQRSHAEYKEGKNLRDMVRENLIAERIAVDSYREMIAFIGGSDPTTRRVLERILAQEEEHADEFADLLDGWIGD